MSCAGSCSTDSGVRNPSTTIDFVAPGDGGGVGVGTAAGVAGVAVVPGEVRLVRPPVGAPLPHRGRLGRDVEPQTSILLPYRDRLDETARREVAVARRPDTRSLNPGAQRRPDAGPEQPFAGRWQL